MTLWKVGDPSSPGGGLNRTKSGSPRKTLDKRSTRTPKGKVSLTPLQLKLAAQRPRFLDDWVANTEIFQDCDPQFVGDISMMLKDELFRAGEDIVLEGTEGESMYFIMWGCCEIFIQGVLVGELKNGASFGELACLGISPHRAATVRAAIVTKAQRLDKSALFSTLQEWPKEQARLFAQWGLTKNAVTGQILTPMAFGEEPATHLADLLELEDDVADALQDRFIKRVHVTGQEIATSLVGDHFLTLDGGRAELFCGERRVATYCAPASFGELALVMEPSEMYKLGGEEGPGFTLRAAGPAATRVLHRSTVQKAVEGSVRSRRKMAELRDIYLHLASPDTYDLEQLGGISPQGSAILLRHSVPRLFAPGQIMLLEGEALESLFLLLHGVVREEGGVVHRVSTGKVIGGNLSELLAGELVALTVTAEECCFALEISLTAVLIALEQCPADRAVLVPELLTTSGSFLEFATQAKTPFFRDCGVHFIEDCAGRSEERIVPSRQPIVEEGSEGSMMYVLIAGRATVVKGGVAVKHLREGDVFGELACLGVVARRDASVIAATPCLLKVLHRNGVIESLLRYPAEVERFSEIVSKHVETTVHDRIADCPFFIGFDTRFTTMMALCAQRKLFLPGQMLTRAEDDGSGGMVVVNLGKAVVEYERNEVGRLSTGAYFGAAVMLGVHKTYPWHVRAQTVCHCLVITRQAFTQAWDKYAREQRALDQAKEDEIAVTQRLLDTLNQRIMQARTYKRMIQAFAEEARGVTDEMLRKQKRDVFDAWVQWQGLQRRNRQRNKVFVSRRHDHVSQWVAQRRATLGVKDGSREAKEKVELQVEILDAINEDAEEQQPKESPPRSSQQLPRLASKWRDKHNMKEPPLLRRSRHYTLRFPPDRAWQSVAWDILPARGVG